MEAVNLLMLLLLLLLLVVVSWVDSSTWANYANEHSTLLIVSTPRGN